MTDFSADVLIAGAGPAGLTAALELGRRGHSVRVIEADPHVGRQPRAKTTNVRSMEHMRRFGLAEKIRAASPLPAGYKNNVVFATGLYGRTITTFENAFYADRIRDDRFSEAAQWIPQYEIERILLAAVEAQPSCRVEFGSRLDGFTQDAEGVTAAVTRGEGAAQQVRARYLIGADGARSAVRKALGAEMLGAGRIGNFLSLVFRAPGLGARHRLGEALMYWLVNPKAPCFVGPMDRGDTWFYGTQIAPDAVIDEAGNRARLSTALGEGAQFEILHTDLWNALKLQASSYGGGRVFLSGDACHLHPPFGGYGMNLGIADSVDLGWKISAMLEGWGGPGLLASYEAERRALHTRVIDESAENMGALMQHFLNPALDADTDEGALARVSAGAAIQEAKDREFHSLGLVIGYDYAGSPIVAAEGGPPPPRDVRVYEPSAAPGCRAPHAWLADGASLFDHFGAGFTLLSLEAGGDAAPMMAAAQAARVPLKVFEHESREVSRLYGARFALIRPDQHVAWRGDSCADAAAVIARARGAG